MTISKREELGEHGEEDVLKVRTVKRREQACRVSELCKPGPHTYLKCLRIHVVPTALGGGVVA